MANLIDRISKLNGPCNPTDILIEIALFMPDEKYRSVCSNAAGTKVVYTTSDGTTETYWAADYTLTSESRNKAVARLRAKEESK